MNISNSDIIALLALLLSAYATLQTALFNKKQKQLIALQEKLNLIHLERESHEAISNTKADISATIIDIGRNKKIRICNQGKSVAKNIRISFPEGNDCVLEGEIYEKFPLEQLEKFAKVDICVAQHLGTKPKFTILLNWDDDYGVDRERKVYLTL